MKDQAVAVLAVVAQLARDHILQLEREHQAQSQDRHLLIQSAEAGQVQLVSVTLQRIQLPIRA
jgi:hypothetical protein